MIKDHAVKETVDFNIEYGHVYNVPIGAKEAFGQDQIRGIEKVNEIVRNIEANGKTYSLSVLIDDYEYEAPVAIKEYVNMFEQHGRCPDFILLESELAKGAAQVLTKKLHRRYLKELGNKLFFSTKTNDVLLRAAQESKDEREFLQIFLERTLQQKSTEPRKSLSSYQETYQFTSDALLVTTEDGAAARYSCAILTACWHLLRLGVVPFSEYANRLVCFTSKPFFGERLITILPAKYMKLEAISMELISAASTKTIKKRRKDLQYFFF